MNNPHSKSKRSFGDRLEETLIAFFLGLMTMITFTNVVIRKFQEYDFWRSDWFAPAAKPLSTFGLLSLEATVFLFAWLVLIGVSYCVKLKAHLGVDIVINTMARGPRKMMALASVACCLLYALLLLKGSWDYWANFANLPATTGRWFPTGFQEKFLAKAWYEVDDVNMPGFLQFIADWMNNGEKYEKIPRFIPYFALPLGIALLLFRFTQSGISVLKNRADRIIASHEVEEEIEQLTAEQKP